MRSIVMQSILLSLFCSILAIDGEDSLEQRTFNLPESCLTDYGKNDWKDCAHSLSMLIWTTQTWYDNQPIKICRLQCARKLKGRVSNFQWVWDAKFECGERAPGIIGEARGFQVRRNAMEQAIAQTIEQGFLLGKLSPNDFQCD